MGSEYGWGYAVRILILGGNGMLGHQFLRAWQGRHDVKVTLRGDVDDYCDDGLFTLKNSYTDVDVRSMDALNRAMQIFRPEAVVNAIGVTKQLAVDSSVILTIEINALFPHQLAALCARYGVRLVHLSTDCIFSGKTGFYDEQAVADAEDLYGRSKFLGEVSQPHVITLRKSTIGLELTGIHGLVEWFLAQRGTIRGYRQTIYSGIISSELARVIEEILLHHQNLSGVLNVASEAINKYDLLVQLTARLGRKDIMIEPFDGFVCDRSLNGAAFREKTGYIAPSWVEMLDELATQIEDREQ